MPNPGTVRARSQDARVARHLRPNFRLIQTQPVPADTESEYAVEHSRAVNDACKDAEGDGAAIFLYGVTNLNEIDAGL